MTLGRSPEGVIVAHGQVARVLVTHSSVAKGVERHSTAVWGLSCGLESLGL